MDKTYLFRMKVPLYEVDMGGGVYHGNYYHFFELAREAMFEEIGFPYSKMADLGTHLTVAEARCIYHEPLRYNDEIEIRSKVTKISNHSLVIDQKILGYRRDRVKTELSISLVYIDREGRATTLPEPLRNGLS